MLQSLTGHFVCSKFPPTCFKFLTNTPTVTSIYPGIFTGVGVLRGAFGLVAVYLRWAQAVRDKEFLVEMRLRNLELEAAKGKPVEKNEEQEQGRDQDQGQEEAAVRDLPVLDLAENQSDEESDNEERFLL